VEMEFGTCFLGVDAAKIGDHARLLRSAYAIAGAELGVKYGISYKQLRSEGPDCYAAGVLYGSLSNIKDWNGANDATERRLAAWRDDKYGHRRYLTGLFRGAYPASIIQFQHFAALERFASGRYPGKVTSLVENNLWIWELTDSEMLQAETLLSKAGL